MKSFMIDKAGYLKSFWNWNDIMLFIFSTATLFQEVSALVKGKINLLEMDLLSNDDLTFANRTLGYRR